MKVLVAKSDKKTIQNYFPINKPKCTLYAKKMSFLKKKKMSS